MGTPFREGNDNGDGDQNKLRTPSHLPAVGANDWPTVQPQVHSTLYTLISTLNNSCHTSTAHPSSSLPPPTQEISNVCDDCDGGGHTNSAECNSGAPPGHRSKLERWTSRFGRASQSHFVPHVLASDVVWARDQICTRAALPATSR